MAEKSTSFSNAGTPSQIEAGSELLLELEELDELELLLELEELEELLLDEEELEEATSHSPSSVHAWPGGSVLIQYAAVQLCPSWEHCSSLSQCRFHSPPGMSSTQSSAWQAGPAASELEELDELLELEELEELELLLCWTSFTVTTTVAVSQSPPASQAR